MKDKIKPFTDEEIDMAVRELIDELKAENRKLRLLLVRLLNTYLALAYWYCPSKINHEEDELVIEVREALKTEGDDALPTN